MVIRVEIPRRIFNNLVNKKDINSNDIRLIIGAVAHGEEIKDNEEVNDG